MGRFIPMVDSSLNTELKVIMIQIQEIS